MQCCSVRLWCPGAITSLLPWSDGAPCQDSARAPLAPRVPLDMGGTNVGQGLLPSTCPVVRGPCASLVQPLRLHVVSSRQQAGVGVISLARGWVSEEPRLPRGQSVPGAPYQAFLRECSPDASWRRSHSGPEG